MQKSLGSPLPKPPLPKPPIPKPPIPKPPIPKPEESTAHAELLDRIIADVAVHGLADRSLRDLATAAGSSHRMLLYHFGSRAGLVRGIVERVEADQRAALVELARETGDTASLIRALWARVSSDDLLPFVRLFFETVAYASRSDAGIDLTGPWLDDSRAAAALVDTKFDPVLIRLGVAVVRGLLVDIVTGASRADANAALERFVLGLAPQPAR